MAQSAHAYVRGNTVKFYEWLEAQPSARLPHGPAIWICGDCHVGNLGPVADAKGKIAIQIRDLDQTVIGNPVHDLIRLGLSLATAARGSDLPGVTTAKMLEQLIDGYEKAIMIDDDTPPLERPDAVHVAMKQALRRTWKQLAHERIGGPSPEIPLGKRFWPLTPEERREIGRLVEGEPLRHLATGLKSRDDDAKVTLLDAAYWMKGCSSLGRLRYALLLDVDGDLCLVDIKEAVQAAAPRDKHARMPRDNGERVVEGARHLAPHLGDRMLATRLLGKAVFLRELLPQDLKIEIDRITRPETMKVARFLADVVGKAHARQMDAATRTAWAAEMRRNRSQTLDAPSWLWSSIVELVMSHEGGYLDHCRRYATDLAA